MFKDILIAAAIVMSAGIAPATAQEFGKDTPQSAPPAAAEEYRDTEYFELVQQSYTMPANFDFARARALYAETSFYEPVAINPRDDFEEFFERQKARDSSVNKEVQAYTYKHFALPEVQSRAMTYFNNARLPKAVAYHEWALRGLSKMMLSDATGLSAEKAYKILVLSEEYMISAKVGETMDQRRTKQGTRYYDILRLQNPYTGARSEMWFDITPITESKKEKLERMQAEAQARAEAKAKEEAEALAKSQQKAMPLQKPEPQGIPLEPLIEKE